MQEETDTIRVIVTEDHPVTRLGLCGIIETTAGMTVIGEADCGEDMIDLILDNPPNVLLLDLMLPDTDGFQLMRQLKSSGQLPNTLVISSCKEEVYAQRVFKTGALGYIMKNAHADEIVTALRTVAAGELYASQTIKDKLFKLAICPHSDAYEELHNKLSDRELEVLTHLSNHFTNKEIAEALKINDRTIATYKARLRDKLGCKDMEELEEKAVALLKDHQLS